MEYRRYKDKIVLRLDKGDEITESILTVAGKEKIALAFVSGIGATDNFTVGVFNTDKKEYEKFCFNGGNYEINSLTGNITTLNKEPYLHLHITCTGEGCKVKGGHLINGVISLTAEIIITVIDGNAGRKFNENLKINTLSFE